MIHEWTDFKTLDSADIMERLNTYEEQEEEKRDLYGSSQRKNHALKVVADSSSDGNDDEDSPRINHKKILASPQEEPVLEERIKQLWRF